MTLLVTGASGFIGRRIVDQATRRGLNVVASARTVPAYLPSGVDFVAADLTRPNDAATLIEQVRPDRLIHAAWETRRPIYWESETNIDWLIATTEMARAFATVGGRRFVQVGSCASYDWSNGTCSEVDTPDRPTTRYGAAKAAAFAAIKAAAMGFFEACEGRVFLLYGPGEEETRFVPLVARAYLAGKVPRIGSGFQTRDLLHVDDVAGALLALAMADGVEGVVNIGSGEPVTLAQVATLLAAATGATETGLGSKPDTPGDPAMLAPETVRLRSIGWVPSISLCEGLKRMVAELRAAQASGHEAHGRLTIGSLPVTSPDRSRVNHPDTPSC